MKLFSLFRAKAPAILPYDRERLEPVIRCSICNGEQVAGFRDKQTGRFEEVLLIKTEADLRAFEERYGISGPMKKIY